MTSEPIFPKLRIGSRLGAYRLIELIGRGGRQRELRFHARRIEASSG